MGLSHRLRHLDSIAGGFIGDKRQDQRRHNGKGSDSDNPCLPFSSLSYPPIGVFQRALSNERVLFPLLGTLLAGLAGLGLGIFLDDLNRPVDYANRKRRWLGLLLFGLCLPAGFFLIHLGLQWERP